jgi:hypothetical protein
MSPSFSRSNTVPDTSVEAGGKPSSANSNLKIEVICCSETSVDFQRTTFTCGTILIL